MKWPHLAPHSRAGLADALATITPLLARETGRRPPPRRLRAALYGHAFNPQQRLRAPDSATASALAWLERASLPVGQLSDPRIIRAALDGLCARLDGSPAAANTITRKRAVFHGALGYAVELWAACRQPGRPGAVASAHRRRQCQSIHRRQPGTSPGDPGPGRLRPAGSGRVLRLPVLRGAASGGSRSAAPQRPYPPGTWPREDDPHRRLPPYRHRLDRHRQAA
jgi:hypothetical protein